MGLLSLGANCVAITLWINALRQALRQKERQSMSDLVFLQGGNGTLINMAQREIYVLTTGAQGYTHKVIAHGPGWPDVPLFTGTEGECLGYCERLSAAMQAWGNVPVVLNNDIKRGLPSTKTAPEASPQEGAD